jgi:hypothetical protein
MNIIVLYAGVLVAVTVVIHAFAISALLHTIATSNSWVMRYDFLSFSLLFISVTLWLLLMHLVEISVWGLFYYWQAILPNAESALYFSGATYTTVGYGDLVLPRPWRLLAVTEAATGVLMFGLSTGLAFAILHRQVGGWVTAKISHKPNA